MIFRALFILFSIILSASAAGVEAIVSQGQADLSSIDWNKQGKINLSGEWQLYWNQLLSPEDLQQGQGQLSGYLSPESEWHKASLPGVDFKRLANATYSLRFRLAAPQHLTVEVPPINTASKVWINGILVQEFGVLAQNAANAQAFIGYSYLAFEGLPGVNTITIQMSNHINWFGGASQPIKIGSAQFIESERIRDVLVDSVTFGFVLFMSLYHIYIWLLLKRNPGPLYFGLFCLSIALRSSITGNGHVLQSIWPDLPMIISSLLEYLGLSSCVGLMACFIRSLYPKESPNWIYLPIIVISAAWSLFIILTGPLIYPAPVTLFQIVIVGASLAAFGTLIIASLRQREGASKFLAGFILLLFTILHDLASNNNLIHSIPLIQYGLLATLFSQSLVLAHRFAQAFHRAEEAEHEVKQFNIGLEHKVQERTEQINTILNHAQSGFLLIDEKSKVKDGFTSSCQSILRTALEVGDCLPERLSLHPHLKLQFKLAVEQVFQGDLPPEVALQQLPARFAMGDHVIGLQAAAVRGKASEGVHAVLLTINDVTDLVAAEVGLKRSGILIRILEDLDAFRIFLDDFILDIQGALKAVQNKDLETLRTTLHTMKGNVASFGLIDLVAQLHEMEDHADIKASDIQNAAEYMRQFLKQYHAMLHLDFDRPNNYSFRIEDAELERLQRSLAPIAPPLVMNRLETWLKSMRSLQLKSYTAPLISLAPRVAEQMHKKVSLELEGAEIKVDKAYGPFLATLNHLIRNAIVHGIEEPDLRGGKPEQGIIKISFVLTTNGGLQIEISDDGQGLDATIIRSKAHALGLITKDADMTESEIYGLIFNPKFSTADSVSELAGRGMGLAAVAKAVQELNGQFKVSTVRHQGTRFSFNLPPTTPQSLDQVS